MQVKIDWISFTLVTDHEPADTSELALIAEKLLNERNPYVAHTILAGENFSPSFGRTPYKLCLSNTDSTIRIYGQSHTATILVEMSGKACQRLDDFTDAWRFVDSVAERLTRIDTAVDIRTDTTPGGFIRSGYSKRFKHLGIVQSNTGSTAYVGSPKSDRFARVYRYNSPHPRHKWLRVEYVFRRKLATIAAQVYTDAAGWQDLADRLGVTWGWLHPDYDTSVLDAEKVPSLSAGTKAENESIAWLYNQVAPAMSRLVNSGALDMTAFLEYVYTGIVPDRVKLGAKLRK